MPVRERKEVQEVLWCLTRGDLASESHTRTRRFRTDPSAPRKLNLRKQAREDGANRDGLHVSGEIVVSVHLTPSSFEFAGVATPHRSVPRTGCISAPYCLLARASPDKKSPEPLL